MNKSYTIIIEKADEGGYIANVPALPGCMTQGDSIEEALENSKEAIEGYIDVQGFLNVITEELRIENQE